MKRQTGFTLVEMMISIVLALLLTGAVVAVFVGSRTAYQATSGVGDMADSGRFALNLIGESVRSAGNLACNSAMSATNQTLVALGFQTNFGQGMAGFEANGTAPLAAIALPAAPVVGAANNWTPNLDPAFLAATPGPFGRPVQGSDVLVVRSSVPRVAPVYTTADVVPGATNLFVTPVPVGISAAQYAAVSDCTKSVIFQVAAVAGGAPSTITLGGGGLPGVGFSAGALVAPLTTTVYYIGTGSDGDSSLWRIEQVNGPGFAAPEELVPDVENMQVLYGIDPAGTQTAAAYVTADQVGTLNVVSIRVALLVSSPPETRPTVAATPYNELGTAVTAPVDNRIRNVFNATINVRDAVN
ncbi:MAG TPA: PilW family protein [Steroidobacteraceae bacterium]|nr:PilW family protein [Steroidobacteraceae bacterium]